jgi:hypothetical protein
MTTYTASYDDKSAASGGGFLLKFILLALMGGLSYWAIAPVLEAAVYPAPGVPITAPVVTSADTINHTRKHAEAESIRQCLRDRGASQVWKSRSWRQPNSYFRVCELDDGRIGVMLVKWGGRAAVWRETTSFIIKDGRPQQALEYLSARATLVFGG